MEHPVVPGQDWRTRAEATFAAQPLMRLLGVRIERLELGDVTVALPFRPELGQQHGYFHGGIIAAVLDVACGIAALTRMEPGQGVVTAELKLNFLAPARDGELVGRGRVVKAGRTLTVCIGEGHVAGQPVALIQATMASIRQA